MTKCNKKLLGALSATAVLLGWQGTAFAAPSLQEQLAAMKQQIQMLEQKIESQQNAIAQGNAAPSAGNEWTKNVTISGVVEVEAGYGKDYANEKTSDLNTATAELGIEAKINDYTSASVVLLWEEDENAEFNLQVDEAIITLAPESTGPFSFTFGRTTLPFGVYETNLISDPLTLELGETSETIAMVGFESNGLYGNAYVFNGDQDKDGSSSKIDNVGLKFGYAFEQDDQSLDASIGYISDLGDSDSLEGRFTTYSRNVPGLALSAKYATGPFTLIGEYIGATKDFDDGNRPKAWHLEAGYAIGDATLAINYQKTKEALSLEFPEKRLAAGISFPVMENTTLSFEWAHDSDYKAADGGTGENADTVTAQLAVEF